MGKHNNLLFYSNVGGLQTKNPSDLIEELNASNFSIICFSETHLTKDNDESEIAARGFNNISVLSNSAHTGGVLLYLKDNYDFKIVDKFSVNYCFWGLTVEVDFSSSVKFYIGVYYRSPSSTIYDGLSAFRKWVSNLYGFLKPPFKNVILVGDMNINWLEQFSSGCRQLKNVLNEFGLNQIVHEFTRTTVSSDTVIDLAFTNCNELKCKVANDIVLSDHKALIVYSSVHSFAELDGNSRISIPGAIDYSNVIDLLKENELIASHQSLDEKFDCLSNRIVDCISQCRGPEVVIEKKKYASFFTKDVVNARRDKISAYYYFQMVKKKFNDGLVNSLTVEAAWADFKIKRNRFVAILRKNKRITFNKQIVECGTDCFKIWKTIKNILKPNKESVFKLQIDDNNVSTDPVEIASTLNLYFVESIRKLNSDIPVVPYISYLRPINSSFSSFQIPTKEDIEVKIKQITTKGGVEPNLTTVTKCWEVVGDKVCVIIQDSLNAAVVPKSLKRSVITPVAKVSGTIKREEMRPINVLPFMDKLLEAIVFEQLMNYINANNILCEHQSGFRAKHSTESAINFVLYDWICALDGDEIIIAVFLDLSRAFETIDRCLLLIKLEQMGITGTVLEWLGDYLRDRTQVVKIAERISEAINCNLGVPQGSKLGPILFILFINDMPNVIVNSCIHLFADDTLLYIKSNVADVVQTVTKLNDDLQRLNIWFKMNKLCLNAKKSKAMVISRSELINVDVFSIYINNVKLDLVNSFKYLGIIIDSKLTFKEHFDYVKLKLVKKVSALGRLRYCLPVSTKRLMFNALIKPQIKYCETLFTYANAGIINDIQIVLNNGLRHVFGIPYDQVRETHVNDLLLKMNMLRFENDIYLEKMVFIFKIVNNLLPNYLSRILRYGTDVHEHQTRNCFKVFLERRKTTLGIKSWFHDGVSQYNRLDKVLLSSKSIGIFKKVLKNNLMSLYKN